MITQYDFFRTKYGEELLIDLIRLESLEKYIKLSPVQRLTYYDITIIADGQGKFSIDSYEQGIRRGSIFFSSPGQIRKWKTDRVPKGYVLIFENEFLCTFFNDTQFVQNLSYFNSSENPPVLRLDTADYDHLINMLKNVQNEISAFKKNDKHMLRALLYQILIFLNRKYISTYALSDKKQPNRYVNNFIQLVNTNHHQYRAVTFYAQRLHITSGHLNSLVKHYLGISAKKYILNRNMLEAKKMLQYTNLGIDEIAAYLNYESTTYFIRFFKQHTNFTPLHFRRLVNP
jgi:AraC family transcriptional regulator, transcriptional activator of pobA